MKDDMIELYVGDAIEHASERNVLTALVDILSRREGWATIFANVHIGGRQIDFVVATASQTLVIEAKHFSRRVKGSYNGPWKLHSSGGTWRDIRNPYTQALDAKHALKDQISAFFGEVRPDYPDTCVVFAPSVSAGSEVPPSDFKVSIINIDSLSDLIERRSKLTLSKDQWAALAKSVRLKRVQSPDAACNPKLMAHQELVSKYKTEFLRTYAPDILPLKADRYEVGDEELDSIGVARQLLEKDDDLLVVGPSGCGKTLLAKSIALDSLANGHIPILIQGKYFSGRLSESIGSEVSLLGSPSSIGLLAAAKATGHPLVLLLDGYNECPAQQQLALTRSLAAAGRRYGARLVVVAQADITRPDLIGARQVAVNRPDSALKAAIAGTIDAKSGNRLAYLLDSVSSGLEADLVGRVGATLDDGASRFALFDAYARQKLGDDASDGVRFLAAVAGQLIGRMSFSLSVRDLDRLAATERIDGEVLGRVLATDLLSKRSDRVSFRHELFFAAFVAEYAARQCGHDFDRVLQALAAPKYRSSRSLILGAYDDDHFVASLLKRISDKTILLDAWNGECGSFSQQCVKEQCEQLLEKLTSEAAGVRHSLQEGIWASAGVCEETLLDWTHAERGLMTAIAAGVWRGIYLDKTLHAIGEMDRSLRRALDTLRAEAKERSVPLRSALFADAYVMSRRTGIAQLIQCIEQDHVLSRSANRSIASSLKDAWERPRTPGQTYLLLHLVRFAEDKSYVIPHILPLLGEQWKYQPYHLQLALLNSVHFAHVDDEDLKRMMIDALEALLPKLNPMVSSIAIEALERLGALDQEVDRHMVVAREDLLSLLSGATDDTQNAHAWRLYSAQFDHPFSSAYCDLMLELSPAQRKRLLTMASRGAENVGFFVSPLIQELAHFGDPTVAPALERWTVLPEPNSFMPQESIAVFVWAHAALGMLGAPLPQDRGDSPSQARDALLALGDIYYWIHRADLDTEQVRQHCAQALGVLQQQEQFGAASTLSLVTRSLSYESEVRESILLRFSNEMALICRNALRNREEQIEYFPHFAQRKGDVLGFSVGLIGSIGGPEDLPLLRSLTEDLEVGGEAINAIKVIEARVRKI